VIKKVWILFLVYDCLEVITKEVILMDLSYLIEHHKELLSYMEVNNYSETYIKRFEKEIKRILKKEPGNTWSSYTDIYLEYAKAPYSDKYLHDKRTIIGALEQFDIYGRFPDRRHRHTLFERGSYHLLVPEFQELIDFYRVAEKQRGKKESTIRGESQNTASFLYEMQMKGCSCLNDITEDAVLSFFISDDGILIKSCSYKKNIAAVLKAGLKWREKECRTVLNYLPALRETRKNIQYLITDEVCLIRETVDSGCVSARNKAVVLLLLYTGLRGCDIAGLKLASVDWAQEKLSINQQKTEVPLELPLSVIVGNAIYEYITMERPDTGNSHLFLSEAKPFTPLSGRSISNIVAKVLKTAGLRQNSGERKGTHIFRHNLASSMLGNGVPQPVIAQTLGHTAPDSLEPYLRADFVHLKECAISVEAFPLAKEVLAI